MLADGIIFSKLDNDCWVLQTPQGRHIKINDATADLLTVLQQEPTLANATKAFNKRFKLNFNETTLLKLVETKFGGLDILSDETYTKPYKKGQYLSLKIPLFNPRVSGFLAAPFVWIFYGIRFWPIFLTMICGLLLIIFLFPLQYYLELTIENLFLFFIIVYPSVLIHELGHIAACRRFKVNHGEIGFGFYLLFPVLYADVTNIWMVEKQKRLIVNLAGVMNEFLYATIIFLFFLMTRLDVLMLAYYAIIIKAFFELNPFLRLDGYWTLSDITGTPNLLRKSNLLLKYALMGKLRKVKNEISNKKNVRFWLILYAILNNLIAIGYCYYIIITHLQTIIAFPGILVELVAKCINLELNSSDFRPEYGLVFFFYIIVIKKLFTILKNILENRGSDTKLGVVRMHV